MHILITTDCIGGVFVFTTELVRQLASDVCRVSLAVLGGPLSVQQQAELTGVPRLDVYERTGALEWMDDPWPAVRDTGEWLLELAQRLAPDCVHLNEFAHGALRWPAPVVMVGHSCVLSWWRAVHHERAPARYDQYRQVVRAGLAAADCVVAPSAAMMIELCQRYSPFRSARVIPNGIDLHAFGPLPKEPRLLAAGRLWDAAKNVTALQRSAAALAWPVYIAGQAHGPDGMEADYHPCQLLGALSRLQIARELARSEIYALPARYEPFGLSVLEAAASGCVLVLGRIPSLLENWYGAACFVDPDDPRELQRVVSALIEDPERREQLRARSLARSRAFDAARMAARYLTLYGELTRGQLRCAS